MTRKTVLILLTDGVSLRNFVYSNFVEQAQKKGLNLIFWNGTPFDLQDLGLIHIPLPKGRLNWFTSVFKNARKHIELNCYSRREKDSIYQSYKFPFSSNGIKDKLRTTLTKVLIKLFDNEGGLVLVRNTTFWLERRTGYYRASKKVLSDLKPDIVYNTSQRSVLSIAPIEAAKFLRIPTINFIYSWDNIPKSTLEVTTGYYHVWSDLMKNELLKYHPFIKSHQITVTGTPQFEMHFNESLIICRNEFYATFNLDPELDYFCFSGDDITTSPKDELYLRDAAEAIRSLRHQGYKIGLIFRPCPVDFSDRYNSVVADYNDTIKVIKPIWQQESGAWNHMLPKRDDNKLLANLGRHCLGVINLGSSMVFDFACHSKPCLYINYHYSKDQVEEGVHVYEYVHFRSMPYKSSVFWINEPRNFLDQILAVLNKQRVPLNSALAWFNIISLDPPKASWNICKDLI